MSRVMTAVLVVGVLLFFAYMGTEDEKSISSTRETTEICTLGDEQVTVTERILPDGVRQVVYEADTYQIIGEFKGLDYKITETQKDAGGSLIPASAVTYQGTYTDPAALSEGKDDRKDPCDSSRGSKYFLDDE